MTVTRYACPDAQYTSTRFTLTTNGVATDVFGYARATEFGVTNYWSLGQSVEQSWCTIAADEPVTCVVTFTDPITSAYIHPRWRDFGLSTSGRTCTFTIPPDGKCWLVVNDERAEPLHIRVVDPVTTPSGTTYNGSQTSVGAGQTLIFPAGGTYVIGQKFKINAGGRAFLAGGSWVIGSFDITQRDDITIDGHGILSGEWSSPEAVALVEPFTAKLEYDAIYGYHASYAHTGNTVRGITIVNSPHFTIFEGVNYAEDVLALSPWYSNCAGITLEADSSASNVATATNCYVWSCDDCLDLGEYIGAFTITDCMFASSASATFIIGYWPGVDYGLATTVRRCDVVAVQSHNEDPESGIVFHAWSDGERTEEEHVIADFTFEDIHVEGDYITAQPINLSHTPYPWGTEADQRGSISGWTMRNIHFEKTPSVLSKLDGFNAQNTTSGINIDNMTMGGVRVGVRNAHVFFDVGDSCYNITIDGASLTS